MGAVNTNFKVIGLTRLVIKPKSTAPKMDAFTTRPSELFTPESKQLIETKIRKPKNVIDSI